MKDVCTLYPAGCLHNIRSLQGIHWQPSWGTRPLTRPPHGQAGPSLSWHVGGTLAGFQLQRGSIRDGHVGGEQIRIPSEPDGPEFRDGCVQQVILYQNVPK